MKSRSERFWFLFWFLMIIIEAPFLIIVKSDTKATGFWFFSISLALLGFTIALCDWSNVREHGKFETV